MYYQKERDGENVINIYNIIYMVILLSIYYDLKEYRVPNPIIFFGWSMAVIYYMCYGGTEGIIRCILSGMIPIILMFPIYLFRIIGAGDVKLFSVIAGCTAGKGLFPFIAYSFIAGAVFSTIHMFFYRSFRSRLQYLVNYIKRVGSNKKLVLYYNKEQKDFSAIIPFSVAIGLGYVLTGLGGYY